MKAIINFQAKRKSDVAENCSGEAKQIIYHVIKIVGLNMPQIVDHWLHDIASFIYEAQDIPGNGKFSYSWYLDGKLPMKHESVINWANKLNRTPKYKGRINLETLDTELVGEILQSINDYLVSKYVKRVKLLSLDEIYKAVKEAYEDTINDI